MGRTDSVEASSEYGHSLLHVNKGGREGGVMGGNDGQSGVLLAKLLVVMA